MIPQRLPNSHIDIYVSWEASKINLDTGHQVSLTKSSTLWKIYFRKYLFMNTLTVRHITIVIIGNMSSCNSKIIKTLTDKRQMLYAAV